MKLDKNNIAEIAIGVAIALLLMEGIGYALNKYQEKKDGYDRDFYDEDFV